MKDSGMRASAASSTSTRPSSGTRSPRGFGRRRRRQSATPTTTARIGGTTSSRYRRRGLSLSKTLIPRSAGGAFAGQVHANVLRALGCVALATNGAVRDVPGVGTIGFQLFAGSIALSHAYVHIVDFGQPVEIAGLPVAPGDIVYGDRHGLQTIPPEIAGAIPAVAADMIA